MEGDLTRFLEPERSGSSAGPVPGRARDQRNGTEAYGSIDEANSALGVPRALCPTNESSLASDILLLQLDLFVAGAGLATRSGACVAATLVAANRRG